MGLFDPQTSKASAYASQGQARWQQAWVVPVSLIIAVGLWGLVADASRLPAFMLPSPVGVWSRLMRALTDGSLARNTLVTLTEVLGGLGLGMAVALSLGYALAKSPTAERLLAPYIVASQSVPTVAIAPLLVIWFGPGMFSKILVAALIVFFPVLVNSIVGVRSVPEELKDLMRSLRATRWQVFAKLEAPAAMPVILGGLKIGATLSVIGAVVGEFVGSDAGLGFLINVGRGQYDTALVFVAILVLVVMALGLYTIVDRLERRLLRWRSDQVRE
ncbi:MAG TPA: ABC transporter permease [Anaerolineales bacterium]|nr:ABC transporter permease [Anaerolineales bacterium]